MTENSTPPPPVTVQNAGSRFWKQRVFVSVLVGIVMTAVPLVSGWISIRKEAKGAGGTDRLWYDLMSLNHALKQFQTHHERVPESIDELKVDRENESYIPLVDPWDRPYWLERKGDTCRIGSYGRDGRPGGVGLDAERSTDNQFPAESQLTLRQYLFEINSSDVWLCGAL
ncbi:MAG TPA: type II secretion system protein GspG, partial [Planctomycetaceae bacterium]|nr:type II secretion system protein GspG [Planctomycetaceae bacterium]